MYVTGACDQAGAGAAPAPQQPARADPENSAEEVALVVNPVTGEQDSRSSPLEFWSVNWQPSAP